MKRKVRVAQYGIGKMGRYLTRYAVEKGGELVAAFVRSGEQVGKDAGELAGIGAAGITVSHSADADAVFKATRPDICLISTKGTMPELEEVFTVCAKNGVNAITIGEEAFWPWPTSPEITERLDRLAKENGCTLSASGYPDVYWGSLVTTVAGSSAQISKIKGYVLYDVENYGIDFVTGHGAGMTQAEFEALHGEDGTGGEAGAYPCLPGDQNGWLSNSLGLSIREQRLYTVAKVDKEDIYCRSLQKTIPSGNVTGMSVIALTETEEGITIEIEVCGKVFAPGECDATSWTFCGEPETTVIVEKPATPALTCATPINRIPQVIDAPPGFVTTDRLPANRYLARPMNEYVTSIE